MRDKIYLIDGSSFLYRFFFAMRGLSYKGYPTSAIFGFAKLLLELENSNPKYIGMFFDTKAKTFREGILESYKKNRPKMPDELSVQIEPTKDLISSFGIPIFELDGFEADDLIATFAEKLKNEFEIIVVASDKDLFQLVEDNVKVYDPVKKVFYDRERVFEKLGVYPEQVADFLALVGDSIDNIPGVKSIGPKTASQLLNEYKSLDGIVENLNNLKPRVKNAIEKELNNLKVYRSLTVVDRDVPISVDLSLLRKKEANVSEIKRIFYKFGFKSLINQLPQDEKRKEQSDGDEVSILYVKDGAILFFDRGELKRVEPSILEVPKNVVVYDMKQLLEKGLNFKELPFDMKLACYLINPDSRGSLDLCFGQINDEVDIKIAEADEFYKKVAIAYRYTKDYIKNNNLSFLLKDVETPLSVVLYEMEKTGLKIDMDYLISFKHELENKLIRIENTIYSLAGEKFNINSTKELQRILFKKLNIKPVKKTKTGFSTDSESLQILGKKHEIANLIITYRAITKIISTYIVPFIEKIDRNDRIHTTFNQTLTSTGRLSSSNPNLQNLPAGDDELHSGIRRSVIAERGYKLICSDYSQIELRVLAELSRDDTLIDVFKNDEDIHTQTAVKLFGVHKSMVDHNLRRMAKTINFGILYGMGYVSLAKTLNISKEKAKQIIERYFERFSKVKEYIESTVREATERKYVETYFGRRRYFFNINSSNKRLAEFEKRAAVNATIQGTAADIIKIAMVRLFDRLREEDARIVLQVHDELLIEAKENIAQEIADVVKETMENVVNFSVPLKTHTKIADNWYEAK